MLGAALTLITLTIGRSSPAMTKPGARSEAWKRFRYCLAPISAGVLIFVVGSNDDMVTWLVSGDVGRYPLGSDLGPGLVA
jgi:hypothetical protein